MHWLLEIGRPPTLTIAILFADEKWESNAENNFTITQLFALQNTLNH